jgi:hypothetical protein
MTIDLSVPIWTIDHIATALHVSVDTAREYTYRADLPAPKAGVCRNLWPRGAVLAWFDALPPRARRAARTRPARSLHRGPRQRSPRHDRSPTPRGPDDRLHRAGQASATRERAGPAVRGARRGLARALRCGHVDAVIDPAETRDRINAATR